MKAPIVAWCLLMACGGGASDPVRAVRPPERDLVKENRDAVRLEDRDIDLYAQRNGLELATSGTGVRHRLLRDAEGANVRPEQWATVNYRVELLNGDTAYSSPAGKPESFLVEMDDVESGLHEAVQLMSVGDSAVVIIPSYRAHGLIGDMDKVPMRSSVVYWIGLVKVR